MVRLPGSGLPNCAAGERLRLIEERREQNAVGRAQVDDVEEVVGARDEGEIVAARSGSIETDGRAAAADAAPANATAPPPGVKVWPSPAVLILGPMPKTLLRRTMVDGVGRARRRCR